MNIEIKRVNSLDDLREVQRVEEAVWQGQASIPIHQYYTAVENGGIIIGAYDHDKLIGFSYGFSGYRNGFTYLCSHMLAFEDSYRKNGLGKHLKERQKEEALKQGYSMICWTFDPLETVNANLNIRKLRGITGKYLENHYGDMKDELNQGLATDRFLVEWWIKSDYVNEVDQYPTILWEENFSLLDVVLNDEGLPFVHKNQLETFHDSHVQWLVPVPDQFQALKKADLSLAVDWRMQTRKAFQLLLKSGYTAVDIKHIPERKICFYAFLKRNQLRLDNGGCQ